MPDFGEHSVAREIRRARDVIVSGRAKHTVVVSFCHFVASTRYYLALSRQPRTERPDDRTISNAFTECLRCRLPEVLCVEYHVNTKIITTVTTSVGCTGSLAARSQPSNAMLVFGPHTTLAPLCSFRSKAFTTKMIAVQAWDTTDKRHRQLPQFLPFTNWWASAPASHDSQYTILLLNPSAA